MQVSIPSASTSTFITSNRVDVVLVPLDQSAVLHGGVGDGHDLVEAVRSSTQAADML